MPPHMRESPVAKLPTNTSDLNAKKAALVAPRTLADIGGGSMPARTLIQVQRTIHGARFRPKAAFRLVLPLPSRAWCGR